MDYDLILLRYGELFLKSEPVRRAWERRLVQNIGAGLKGGNISFEILRDRGRLFVRTKQIKEAMKVLQRIFGLVSISPCYWLKTSQLKEIQRFCKENYARWIEKGKTFAVRATRTNKHPYTSQELARVIGDVIDRKVDLKNPDVELFIEVRKRDTYVYTERLECPGGLPLGVSGKVVCLISGGIDSPVAAWKLMKRGCEIVALYADNSPYTDETTFKRFVEVVKVLKKWYIGAELKAYAFDHGSNLKHFIENAPRNLTCVLCKRMMYRVANELARRVGAEAIVTGEVLAQVASQTAWNLRVLDQASELPVLRPLIGNDKEENVAMAKAIGTYEKSCLPVMSCQAVPKKPRTRAKLERIIDLEKELYIPGLMRKSQGSLRDVTGYL